MKPTLDSWSLVHFTIGWLAGKAGVGPLWYGLSALGYEILENSHEGAIRRSVFGASGPESLENSIADVGLGLLGYAWGRTYGENHRQP